MAEQRAERATLDPHVGAKQVLAVEIEKHPAYRGLQERDAALVAGRCPRVLTLALVARERSCIGRQQRLQVAFDRRLHATRDERRRVGQNPDVLVGQRRGLDTDGAREFAAGHQEDRYLGVPRPDGAQQLRRLFASSAVVTAPRPVDQDAVDAGIGHDGCQAVLVRHGFEYVDVPRPQLRDERAHAACRGARRLRKPAIDDENLAGERACSCPLHHGASVANETLSRMRVRITTAVRHVPAFRRDPIASQSRAGSQRNFGNNGLDRWIGELRPATGRSR